jgi:hypothetical protein
MADNIDAWPLMMQFAAAGINPAMVEAYLSQDGIPDVPDPRFFEQAHGLLRSAQKSLGAAFETLGMERKIALLDLLDELGPEAASQKLNTVDKSSAATALQALTSIIAQPGTRTQRAVDSLVRSRLEFAEPTLNSLRDGDLPLSVGAKGPAVRYLHRLLQVSQRVLSTPQTALEPFDSLHGATLNAIKQFEAKAFPKAVELQSTGLSVGRYTVAFLELIVFFAAPPKLAAPSKKGQGMLVFGQKDHLLKIKIEDFADYMILRQKIWSAHTPGSQVPELGLALGEDDLKRFKYLLAYVQDGHKEELDRLKKLAERVLTPVKTYAKESWDKSSTLTKIGLISGAVGLVGYSVSRALEGKATRFDEAVLEGTGALLKQFPIKLISPKKASNLQTTPNTWDAKVLFDFSEQTFRDAMANKTERQRLTVGGSTTFSRNRRLPAVASQADLKAQGFKDERVWYCERTCGTYLTSELKELLDRKELSLEDMVLDLTSAQSKPAKLGMLPLFAAQELYSSTQKQFSVRLEASTQLFSGLDSTPSTFKVRTTWENWALATSASAMFKDKENPFLKDPDNPKKQAMITGYVRDLEATLERKVLLGLNTSKHSSTLDLWLALKDSEEVFPLPDLTTHVISTTLGGRWTATREGKSTIKLSLSGSMYANQLATGKTPSPDAHLHLELMKRKLTLYLDTKVQLKQDPQLSSLSLRFFYTLGGSP